MRRFGVFAMGALVGGAIVWAAVAQEIGSRALPFSRAREAGNTLYLSGQIARTSDGVDVRDSVAAETRKTMENLGAVLGEHGYTWSDVVSVTVYLRDLADYAEMNEAYAEFFDEQYPARACVGGVDIVFDHRVEISAIAHRAD